MSVNKDFEFFKSELPKLVPKNLSLKKIEYSGWSVKTKGIFGSIFGKEIMFIDPSFFGTVRIYVKDISFEDLANRIGEHFMKIRKGKCEKYINGYVGKLLRLRQTPITFIFEGATLYKGLI